MDKVNDFKKDLKALLEKYNAEIYVLMDGDTHGCSAEVCIDVDNKEVMKSHDSISHYDIK
jgi:hypothetical protein